ncbi:hypothetical protein pEaSNUABM14_00223 [Erwinia phage pEa_SNUABM_14]|uniref:Uncharacterized protein n=1 Tax=Erwinia phage pEa_SNUABM_7 TaxID=2866695 RepID=A0AAE7WTQ9_9CAUD|nr:hypothetical protein MPK74_gp224 [Erwinia phage pEa_SNUABM_7]QYW04548.1 hypothetical protein pEaSNUABM14_00223 [Erwinia phage pEa_SNUABM_14]QYW04892.1 hypothetical protein pEaSNUABM7_00224 [Erwinia phage pEa_SNUABM_7]
MNIELETRVMNMLAGISRHLVKLGKGDVAAYQDRFFYEHSFSTLNKEDDETDVVAVLREKIVAELAVRDIALTEDYQPVLTYRPMILHPTNEGEFVSIVVGFPLDAPVVLP